MAEIWKDILGYEGLYQVSDLGNIKSLNRIVPREKGPYYLNGKHMKITTTVGGYRIVRLSNVKSKNYLVHRLVAIAFLNNPKNYKDVDHIDQNPSNNNVGNLRWASRSLNNINSEVRCKNKTSKFIGVHFCKQTSKWKSCVTFNNKAITIGRYNSEHAAAIAHDDFCIKNKIDSELNFKRSA